MLTTSDFLSTLVDESARFRAAIVAAAPSAVVPTCPDWDADDLLWHLSEVQWFWGQISGRDITPEGLEHPKRPGDREGLLAFFDEVSHGLQTALAALDPEQPRWMWTQDESLHRVSYLARRQAHEALIHRVDAELTSGRTVDEASPIDPVLAADGIDEVLEVMYGREHRALTFTPEADAIVQVVAEDTGATWLLQLGRERGEVEGHGAVDDANFRVIQTGTPRATISGAAADVDLWLWNRPTAFSLIRQGDAQTIAALEAVLADGLQ